MKDEKGGCDTTPVHGVADERENRMANRRANEVLKKQGKASKSTSGGTKHCCDTMSVTFNLNFFFVTPYPFLFKSYHLRTTLYPVNHNNLNCRRKGVWCDRE
jgi:hypothetical protein